MSDRAAYFESETWTAGVIGLGYVGLPLAVNAAQRGLPVIGFDVSGATVERIESGDSPIDDVPDGALSAALEGGLTVTTAESALSGADALFICVPSPLNRDREPDLTFIEAAAATVGRVVRSGMLVSLESTTYPGTTEEVLVPAVTSGGLTLDSDVFVAFSPERVNPGSDSPIGKIPKVVGGVTPESGRVAAAAYRRLVDTVHLVSSARAAEMTKLLENTYRAVNIAMVNEMAALAHEIGIDIWEVIGAAATKPFGFQAFYPGPGVGGHCIPLDPQYLAWRAKEVGFDPRFIDLAEQVNIAMPGYTARRITALLDERGMSLRDAHVLAVGASYKPNVGDARESPALEVMELLREAGARVSVWDPLVPGTEVSARGFEMADGPDGHDLAVVLTDHDLFDLEALAGAVPLVFDTRGAYPRRGLAFDSVVTL